MLFCYNRQVQVANYVFIHVELLADTFVHRLKCIYLALLKYSLLKLVEKKLQ